MGMKWEHLLKNCEMSKLYAYTPGGDYGDKKLALSKLGPGRRQRARALVQAQHMF